MVGDGLAGVGRDVGRDGRRRVWNQNTHKNTLTLKGLSIAGFSRVRTKTDEGQKNTPTKYAKKYAKFWL